MVQVESFQILKDQEMVNKEKSESKLMDYEERQDKDMSLGDEEWTLKSKKQGTQTWEMRHKARFMKLHGNLKLKIWWQHVLWIWGQIWSNSQSSF